MQDCNICTLTHKGFLNIGATGVNLLLKDDVFKIFILKLRVTEFVINRVLLNHRTCFLANPGPFVMGTRLCDNMLINHTNASLTDGQTSKSLLRLQSTL